MGYPLCVGGGGVLRVLGWRDVRECWGDTGEAHIVSLRRDTQPLSPLLHRAQQLSSWAQQQQQSLPPPGPGCSRSPPPPPSVLLVMFCMTSYEQYLLLGSSQIFRRVRHYGGET